MDHQKIYSRALKAVSAKNISDVELVLSIENVWRAKTHYVYGCRSLFDFTCNKLNMSEELTSIFNKIAKKCAVIPQLKSQIASGQLSISKANRICSVITPKNAEHWLKLAQGSKRALEKEVAKASPAKKLKERARLYNAGDELQVDIRFAMTLEEFKDFERSRDLLSQRLGHAATIQETMVDNTRTALSKNDPLKKSCPPVKTGSQKMTVILKRQVQHKCASQCMHVDENGVRCQQRRHIDIHHIKPILEGGTNELDNLTILCSGHHRAHHQNSH